MNRKLPTTVDAKPMPNLARRRLCGLLSLGGLLPAGALAQLSVVAPLALRKLHSVELLVSDLPRSLAFYQNLFGAPIQARQGETVCLRVGSGPQYISLRQAQAGQRPRIAHIGLAIARFDLLTAQSQLDLLGVPFGKDPQTVDSGLDAAMTSWRRQRFEDQGGAAEGTMDLFFEDMEGIRYQLMPEDACGGAGRFGERCAGPEPAPSPGHFELVDFSHFTTFVANSRRANNFYTRIFAKQFQAYQGAFPIIGVGNGTQFLMYVGGQDSSLPTQPGRIDHVCFSVRNFDVDSMLDTLDSEGLAPRPDGGDIEALQHWVSLRMPARGGAQGGTPELYFSDPDGLSVQLQDPAYCGGSGYLGESCPPL
jgi:catechol 2,3-dioxygenase-like lactoylglutathione lyase family enzyme